MIVDCIADLHGHYPELEGGDLLIVAGDMTKNDSPAAWDDFFIWIDVVSTKYTKIICIAGNHDRVLTLGNNRWDFYKKTEYLEDSGTEVVYTDPAYDLLDPEERVCLDKKTLKVWGSPWTLAFPGMNPACKAFTVDTEKELAEKWKLIPDDVDILITHGPAYGILDEVKDYANGKIYNTGSKSLKHAVSGLSKLKLHVFGHIHEQGGEVSGLSYTVFHEEHPRYEETKVSTTRVNCSYVNEHYKPVNKPVRIIL